MKNKIVRIVLALIAVISVFIAFLFVEDSTYDEIKPEADKVENRKAMMITWEASNLDVFWKDYETEIHPVINGLHQKGLINEVLPFHHEPLHYQNSEQKWTNIVVLMLRDSESMAEVHTSLISAIEKSSIQKNFRALDFMRLQRGLDMFYPINNGLAREAKMNQNIEYLFSDPEARKDYYEDQYLFSGPAMRDLHHRDKAGRFVGFELEKRLASSESMPEWDLIHIIGFTTWQEIKAAPFFYSTWNKHAERAFGEGMTLEKKVAEWNEIRTNVKSPTIQKAVMTLRKN
ncbi:MAG: hypothetical protein AAGA64_11620 [Bacteroidota bacterium]